jgi:benzoyl-CoA reductase subunit B
MSLVRLKLSSPLGDSLAKERPKTREEACRMLAEWHLHKPEYQHFYFPHDKSQMMIALAKHWKLNGVMLHYKRGCESLSLGIAENRLAILEAGIPVMAFDAMGFQRGDMINLELKI